MSISKFHINKVIRCSLTVMLSSILLFAGSAPAQAAGKINAQAAGQTAANNNAQAVQEADATICMVGDVLLHDRVTASGKKSDGTYNYDALFAHVTEMTQGTDLAIANQEVILGGQELGISGYPTFNGPYEVGDALADAGFDVICHGTNHALDRGAAGIKNCINFWNTNYPQISVLGIHDSAASQNTICIRDVKGIKVAVLNYTFSTNGIALPSGMPYAVDMLNESKVISDLKKAEANADFTIVCPHWGTEYTHGTTAYQTKWAKIFADNGADLVIGTHPHVIEPIGTVDKPDGTKMPVYYSSGNFVNATSGKGSGTADRMLGAMARITISKTAAGTVTVKSYDALPLISHVGTGFGGVTVYPMSDYTEALAQQNEIRKQDCSFSLKYCQTLWNKVMFGK